MTLVSCLKSDNPWQAAFARSADEIVELPDLGFDSENEDAFLEYLLMSRAIDVVLVRNSAVGYRLVSRWSRRYREVRYVDLLHLHNFGEDWVHDSLPHHSNYHRRYLTNEDLRRYILNTYQLDPEPFRVIYCGVDTHRWYSASDSKGKLREELRLGSNVPVVGFVGRVEEQKDPLRWIEVADRLAAEQRDMHFVMVGDGSLLEECHSHAAGRVVSERLHFLGYRGDIPEIMTDLDILLLTSPYEDLPQVVFEALISGTSVVASDAGGTREALDGDVGVVLPVSAAPEVYANEVLKMFEWRAADPDLAERCKRRVRENFVTQRMQEAFRKEFEELRAQVDRERRLREYRSRDTATPPTIPDHDHVSQNP